MTLAPAIDPVTQSAIQQMVGLARSGQIGPARAAGKAALADARDPALIHALLGRMACEAGDFADGIAHLREALAALPDQVAVRCDLVAALTQTGATIEALEYCDRDRAHSDPSLQLARFRAYLSQETGDFPAAIETYRHIVAREPRDFAAWNNLGNSLSGAGDFAGAIEALREAVRLEPLSPPTRINLATALTGAGETEQAIEALRKAAADFPDDATPWTELGRVGDSMGRADLALEAVEEAARRAPSDPEILVALGSHRRMAWDFAGAEQAFAAAIAADPGYDQAYVSLAVLFDHDNRGEDLTRLVQQAEAASIDPRARKMVEALALRREKKWQDALSAAQEATDAFEPVRRAQLIGECRDRLDDPAGAFAAFEDMNRQVEADTANAREGADEYRAMVDRNRSTLTKSWVDSWKSAVPPATGERAAPTFLLGFPRSGTTLLDTILMGYPDVQVYEERPAIVHVEHDIGGIEALPAMDSGAVRAARDNYWSRLDGYAPLRDVGTVIDKMPLYLNKTAIIHRLFPDARFILSLRHPMDVVLSCFITNFRPNSAMSNFHDLVRTAELYDRSFAAFEEARKLLGLPVFTVAYERMIADRDAELRPLFDWLGLDWEAASLDHQATAAGRGIITTASYAQVHEPIYTRATGRWARYREQLKPVEAILAPWIERFGYSLDDPAQVPTREAM